MRSDKSDFPQLKKLWLELFEDSPAFVDFFFASVAPWAKIFTLQEDGQLVSMLFSMPRVLSFEGEPLPARYLLGIGTLPAYRHRGYMTELLKEAFAEAEKADAPLVYLSAVDAEIYKKAGFVELCTQRFIFHSSEYIFDTDDLVTFMNTQLSRQVALYLPRSKEYFEQLLKDVRTDNGDIRIFKDESDAIAGYYAYSAEPEPELRDGCIPETQNIGAFHTPKFPLMIRAEQSLLARLTSLSPDQIYLPELY